MTCLIDEYLVSTTDINILSTAFECIPNYVSGIEVSNPYYWHKRSDFNHKADPFQQSNTGSSGELGLSAAGIETNENQQLKLFSLSDPGINLDDNLFTTGSDPFFSNSETVGSGEDLFASSQGAAEETFPMNLFSVADSDTDTFDSLGDSSLAVSDAGSNIFSKRGGKKARAV